jgi:hypothetical protein
MKAWPIWVWKTIEGKLTCGFNIHLYNKMVRNLTFALGLVGLLSLASCTKDYSCSCTLDYGQGDTTITLLYEGVKKGDAEEGCTAAETTYKIADPSATCTLD